VLTVPLTLRLLAPGANGATLHACLARHYAKTDHVHVLPLQESSAVKQLDPQMLNGTNDMRLSVFPGMAHGHVLLSAVFDNLGKGASGAAIQNLDLMLA
jgi:N-acetyl-gamma-glutamyl-phosphate reductase